MEPFDLEGGKGPIWDDDEPLGLGLPSDSQPPLFDTRDLGLDLDVPEASDALPASEFMALRLDSDQIGSSAVPSGGGGMAPAPGAAPGDDGEDPFKALEAAIEEDNPRVEISPEWQRMLQAVAEEETSGVPALVPDRGPEPTSNGGPAGHQTADAPTALEAFEGGGEQRMAGHMQGSPAHVLAVQDGSMSTDSGGSRNGGVPLQSTGESLEDLAGHAQPQHTQLARQDPETAASQAHEDIIEQEYSVTLQKQTFAALQPVCSRLLASRSDAVQLTALLVELRQLLEAANLEGLKGCVDYVLFPLQLALDAVAATRGTDTPGDSSAAVALPALASDKAAEAALAALLALMRRCPCDKPEQLLALLQRLSAVLAAPREKMSEELRLCALEILEAVLRDAVPGVLAEEDTAPLLGLLISLLLKCAHAELQAGTSGSKTVRTHALRALRLLVQAVDSPEALTFFLPGLVTGLGKALLDASGGRAARGGAAFAPAASGSAAVEALQCLVAVLLCTLGNAAVAGLEEESEEGQEGASKGIGALKLGLGGGPAAALSSEEALASLASLAEKAKAPPGGGQNNTGLELAANEAPPALPPMPPRSSGDGAASRLRVERSLAWVQASAGRVKELLEVLVPRIAADPRPPVRVALVEGCATLAADCSLALYDCRTLLLDSLFALAQDEWPQVASAAKEWLQEERKRPLGHLEGRAMPDQGVLVSPALATAEASLQTWLAELPAALRRGDEAGRVHALKVVTCLQVCPADWVAARLLPSSAAASRLVDTLAECFQMDSETAGLLSQAVPEPTSTAYLDARPAAEGDASHATQPSTTPYIPGAVLLPRMPLGLQFVTTVQTYTAVATVVRSLAAVAVAADARAGQGSRGGSSTCAYLQTLVQACLQNLQSQVVRGNPEAADVSSGVKKKSGMKQRKAPQPITPAAQGSDLQPWQLSAAQVIALLAEVLFGACPAGTAGMQIKTSNGTAQTDATADNVSKELETAVAAALPEVVDELIWSLPTSFQQSTGYGAAPQGVGTSIAPMLPPTGAAARQRGWNALLQRAALDCIGTAARALGQRFTANGRTLRVILLPTLEKLGEPCALVSAAAQAAVTSFCVYCGYGGSGGGLRQLVADNADYIVDGMCLQLRQPHAHPRAPQLFATLLRQSGVAPGLLPLLAEPARQALQGVSIIARRRRPEHVLPFVLCIREIAKGAGVVAAEALADHETFAAVLERRWDAQQEKNAAEKASQDAVNADDGAEDDQAVKMEDIARFFEERRAQEVDEASNVPGALEDHPAAHERVAVSLAEWNDVQLTRRRAVACATLAQSAADTAGPLALSSSLPVAVQALRGCREALHALASASRCHELFAQSIEVRMAPPGGVTVPGECNPATLLPSVHLLWSPLMGSLDDWRIGVVECALESLSDLACLAGSFLTRRFGQEAWPKMERLLREGPSLQRIIAPGQDDLRSPVVVQRAQRAVLNCLREIAAGGDEAASVLAPLAHSLLAAVAEVMGEAHPSPVREVATSAFAALAGVDPDAAWALLVTALRSIRVAAVRHPEQPSSEFPAFEALCPLPRGGAVPSGLRSCGEAKLQALVQQVGFMPARWHDHADRLLTASF